MNKQILEQAIEISNQQHGFFGDGNDQVFHIYTQLSLNLEHNMRLDLEYIKSPVWQRRVNEAKIIAAQQHGFFQDEISQILHIADQITHVELVDQLRKELIDQYGWRSLAADEDELISMLDSCEITPAIDSIVEQLNNL
jgi:hypothetical protein